ncbi:hypothetical protein Tco_0510538 [Tanacetum coccineum]
MVQAPEDMGEDSAAPTDSHSTPIITQPSSTKPQNKQSRRKQRKDSGPTEPIPDEATNEEHVSTLPMIHLKVKVLDLEKAKTAQAMEIASLNKRVKQLEKIKKLGTLGLKRLKKVGLASKVESSNDISLERIDEEMSFDVQDDLQGEEVVAEKEVAEKEVSDVDPVTTTSEVVTTANVKVTTAIAPTTTIDKLTLAQTLIEIKAAKPKAVTIAATTTTATTTTTTTIDELTLAKQKEEQATIALIETWDNTQVMIEADRLLAKRLQTREQEELTDEEKARLFVELLEKRKKHFTSLRAQEKRSKPSTNKSYDEIQEMFDKEMKRVNTFVDMNAELVKGSKTKVEGSSKRAGDELEQEKAKKKKGDVDQEEEEMKKNMEIVQDDEVAIDAIPLATKPLMIIEYKIDKEGKMGYFKLIRADGNSKRYSLLGIKASYVSTIRYKSFYCWLKKLLLVKIRNNVQTQK